MSPDLYASRPLSPDLAAGLRVAAPRVTVIGDHLLDGWWTGTSSRMCREAPAPVVDIDRKTFVPGGAANTAMNLAALGASVRAIGIVGDDEPGHRLRALLLEAGVDVSGLLAHPGVATTTKIRVMGADQVLLRLDDQQRGAIPEEARLLLLDEILESGAEPDAEVVCDYGSGLLDGIVVEAMSSRRERPPITVVDAHDAARWAALEPTLVTPNAAEASSLLGRDLGGARDRADAVLAARSELLAAAGAQAAVVTLDREGTVLLTADGQTHRTHAKPTTEKQASGAGDTFVAVLTAGYASGLSLPTSADLAQAAADVVVQRFGTSVCSTDDLVAHLGNPPDPALPLDRLADTLSAERDEGKRIVFTNGCFDVLTRGHTVSLTRAKRLGDVLVVAVNSDDSTRRLRGRGHPLNPAADRAGVLAALECVDYVTVFDEDTAVTVLERLRPDVYVKGGDYIAEPVAEATAVRAYGGEVRLLEFVPDHADDWDAPGDGPDAPGLRAG